MRRAIQRVPLVLFAAILTLSPAAQAVDFAYSLGAYSHYVWRGLTVTDDPAFQPSLTVSHDSGFSLNFWANMDLGDANDLSGEINEVDYTLAYSWGGDVASFSVGYVEYTFPSGLDSSTSEVYFSVGFDVPTSPSLSIYYDFDQIEDYYASVAFSHGFELSETAALTLGASFGFAGDGFAALSGGTDSGFHDGNVSLSLNISPADSWGWGLLAAYTDSLDDDVLLEQPADFWGGVVLNASF